MDIITASLLTMTTTTTPGKWMRQGAATAMLGCALACTMAPKATAPLLSRSDGEGYDGADAELGPTMTWLPVISEPHRPAVIMTRWNGIDIPTLFDTGATDSALPTAVIDALQLPVAFTGAFATVADAVGSRSMAPMARMRVAIGASIVTDDLEVLILPSDSDTAVIGMDLLLRLDVRWRPDEGSIGVRWTTQATPERTRPTAVVSGVGSKGAVAVDMIIDTGSSRTAFPTTAALQAGLPSRMTSMDRSEESGVFGQQRQDGFWLLQPMVVIVGKQTWVHARVLARERLSDDGLLGWDVLSRQRLELDGGVASLRPIQGRHRLADNDIVARWDDWTNDERFAQHLELMTHPDREAVMGGCVRLTAGDAVPNTATIILAADRGDDTVALWPASWRGTPTCVGVPLSLDIDATMPIRVQWLSR